MNDKKQQELNKLKEQYIVDNSRFLFKQDGTSIDLENKSSHIHHLRVKPKPQEA